MEKFVVGLGFGMFYLFFLFALCIDTIFVWASLSGLMILLFGWWFWDET